MTKDDVYKLLEQKDAEIDRMKARLEESYAKQTYKEWERNNKLIGELADLIHSKLRGIHHRLCPCDMCSLLQRARKVIK